MNRILLITIIVICFIFYQYIVYYTKYKNDIQIIQGKIANINYDVLSEKYPIIISNKIYRPLDLLGTIFKYTYLYSKISLVPFENKVKLNLSKFVLLCNSIIDVDVHIIHPKNKIKFIKSQSSLNKFDELDSNVEYTTIKLKQHQILILPAFWMYHSTLPLHVIELDDIFSQFIKQTYRMFLTSST